MVNSVSKFLQFLYVISIGLCYFHRKQLLLFQNFCFFCFFFLHFSFAFFSFAFFTIFQLKLYTQVAANNDRKTWVCISNSSHIYYYHLSYNITTHSALFPYHPFPKAKMKNVGSVMHYQYVLEKHGMLDLFFTMKKYRKGKFLVVFIPSHLVAQICKVQKQFFIRY